jgi:hypothetical protein
MERNDGPADPPAPVLDYGTPPPADSRSLDGPTVRFAAGAAVPVLAILVVAAFHGDEMILCAAIGGVIELFLIGGSFQVGQRLCRRAPARALVERHWALTIAAGLLSAMMIVGALAAGDVVPRPLGVALCLLSMFAVPAIAPWAALRDEQASGAAAGRSPAGRRRSTLGIGHPDADPVACSSCSLHPRTSSRRSSGWRPGSAPPGSSSSAPMPTARPRPTRTSTC